MNIVDYIPKGKENAITRENLMLKTGLPDRQMRELISKARCKNAIVNDQDGQGYYIAETEEELRRFICQETARASHIFAGLKAARLQLKEIKRG